jgi:hypothetical protein
MKTVEDWGGTLSTKVAQKLRMVNPQAAFFRMETPSDQQYHT